MLSALGVEALGSSLAKAKFHRSERRMLNALASAASRTPSADNSQPWRFAPSPGQFHCSYIARPGWPDPFGPTGHANLIAGGAMHESLRVLFPADAAGHAVGSQIGPKGWSLGLSGWAACDTLSGAEKLDKRHTNRHPYRRDPVSWAATPRPWTAGTRVSVMSARDSITQIAGAIRLCSAARFNTRDLHEWLFSSIRWTEEDAARGDGLDIASLHLPPGGRHFMRFITPWSRMELFNRVGLYRLMAAIDAKLVSEAPAIVAITGGNAPDQIWEAGRAMMDAWVSLNAAGYAVHPYYVVTDIANRLDAGKLAPEWKADTLRALGMVRDALRMQADEHVHLLMRVGKPTRNAVRSKRLPIERLLVTDGQ